MRARSRYFYHQFCHACAVPLSIRLQRSCDTRSLPCSCSLLSCVTHFACILRLAKLCRKQFLYHPLGAATPFRPGCAEAECKPQGWCLACAALFSKRDIFRLILREHMWHWHHGALAVQSLDNNGMLA